MLKETQHTEFKLKFNEDVVETLVAFGSREYAFANAQYKLGCLSG